MRASTRIKTNAFFEEREHKREWRGKFGGCYTPISIGYTPLQIAILNEEKCCPVCGFTRKEGFDIGETEKRIWGTACPNCERTHGVEGYQPGLSDRSSESVQGDSGNESPGESQSGVYD